MTQKQLKRLNRADLIKLLIEQSKKNEELKAQLASAQEELERRRIIVSNAGSIAEASLQINKVFETAQKAADQYLESLKNMVEEQ